MEEGLKTVRAPSDEGCCLDNLQKEPYMLSLPSAFERILLSFSFAFTEPTFQRMLLLSVGGILARGRRTVTNMIWTMRSMIDGHFSDYHRVFSRASWSLWPLGRTLASLILRMIPEDEPIFVPMDDTTAQHRGAKVYGKGCHHDAVRSAHKHIVFKWGHRWVVLAIAVKFPFVSRHWALPVLVALYKPKELNQREGRRHKTALDLARQLICVLMHWFPKRRFICLGDGGFASHELARFAQRHDSHCTLVSRFHPRANLYEAPPVKRPGQAGRPPMKGKKLPSPAEVVKRSRLRHATVSWYGGGKRRVGLVSGIGHWYKGGCGLVAVRWVYVKDFTGTHRDDWLYTTDIHLQPEEIVTFFTRRWGIETTFQEVRAHLGFETTRQWVPNSVRRTAPILLGLHSLVCLLFAQSLRSGRRVPMAQRPWYAKQEPTFADAITEVRRLLWAETVLKTSHFGRLFKNLRPQAVESLLDQLSLVA
jgi:hypothetical protein